MKRQGSYRMGLVWLGVVLVMLMRGGGTAEADFIVGTPANLGPVVNSEHDEQHPSISGNGLELYFMSRRPGGVGDWDIWVTRRETISEPWGEPANLGPTVNDIGQDWAPCISADGLELYFEANRPGGQGGTDILVASRKTTDGPWDDAVNLGPVVNTASRDGGPSISADGLELYFKSNRPSGGYDHIWVSRRSAKDAPWGTPVNLGPPINSLNVEREPSVSADGLVLFFASDRLNEARGWDWDIWLARRDTKNTAWGEPVNLGPRVNTTYNDDAPSISLDGRMLYFSDYYYAGFVRPGGYGGADIWQAPIIPILDFNGDGTVDATDMALLEDNWARNEPLCDVGPMPWGDGVVDQQDLGALMESLMTPSPKASDVSCDVALSWIVPSFSEGCDVYFGTSFTAVDAADRDNPLDVLVSMEQPATTYAPPGFLEFSQTYYWRIDTVVGLLEAAIYKGPVLSFTVEDFAYPIQSICATASSGQRGMGPDKTVDGSGLDPSDGHSYKAEDMWLSASVSPPHWIEFEFDQVYALHELWVWNSNQLVEPVAGFGAKTVKIEYSIDGMTWTALDGVPEFAKAPGRPDYVADIIVSFGGVSARYVKLTVEKGWGVTPAVGLSEVRFFHIPDRPAPEP